MKKIVEWFKAPQAIDVARLDEIVAVIFEQVRNIALAILVCGAALTYATMHKDQLSALLSALILVFVGYLLIVLATAHGLIKMWYVLRGRRGSLFFVAIFYIAVYLLIQSLTAANFRTITADEREHLKQSPPVTEKK